MLSPRRIALVVTALGVALATGCATPAPLPADELSRRLQARNLVLAPEGAGPFPAVLLLHTCYGNLGHADAWAARLQGRGYVAVVVNSMGARDLDGHFDRMAVCGGRVLRSRERARDIRLSVEQLRAAGNVDMTRIALVGFSHGGWTALDYLARPPGPEDGGSGSAGPVRIKGVVAVYPYCGGEAMEGLADWPRGVRTLMLLAGNDQTVSTPECQALARAQAARGFLVETHVYPGARHGYDIDPALIFGYDQRYDAGAALDTRRRIIRFLDEILKDDLGESLASAIAYDRPGPSERHATHPHRRLR